LAVLGGGWFVAPDGRVSANSPAGVAALSLAASWIGTIAPPGVLNYQEEDAREAFESGDAVFLRNWPYVWTLVTSEGSPVRGQVGRASLPAGGTLGGWSLAVAGASRHPRAAVSLVAYLASAPQQKLHAQLMGLNPTLPELYDDPVLRPEIGPLRPIFENAIARPSRVTGPRYPRVSAEIWEAVHSALSGQTTPALALERLQSALERIGGPGRW
jgi:trehalose/maltose transport system substrate-binding protein